jgi:hypothetical protein
MSAASPAEIARANLQQAISAWTPGIKPTWTISEVRHALRTHRQGIFSYSAQLVDTMVDAVLEAEFELQPVDAPNRQLSKRIAEQFGPLWDDSFPDDELRDFIGWYEMLGAGVACLDWDRRANRWGTKLRTLPPHFLRVDEYTGRWLYQAQEGELEVVPGDGRWVLLTDGQRGWMHGKVRRLAVPWVGKELNIRDWSRYNERHGLPIIKAKAPAIADEGDKDQFWEDMQSLGQEAVAQLPTHLDDNGAAFDLDLLEAKDQSWKSFEASLERSDRRFTVVFLGANLSTEVASSGANRAASQTHDKQLSSKATALGKRVSTKLRAQGLWPLVSLNTPGASFEATPWPKWHTEPPEDAKTQAEGQKVFLETVKASEDAGYEIENLEELAEQHSLKLKKVEKPEPAPPPAPGAPNDQPPPTNQGAQLGTTGGASGASNQRRTFAARLASGDTASGFLEGQLFADALVEQSTEHAIRALKPTTDAILAVIDSIDEASRDPYGDLRTKLRELYTELDPSELSALVEKAMVLANLAGRAAVLQDF